MAGTDAGAEEVVVPGVAVAPGAGGTDGVDAGALVEGSTSAVGVHSGLRLGLDGTLRVRSWRRRTASGRLSAWMPCLTRSCATVVRSSSRAELVSLTLDRSRPAIRPGTPRKMAS